MGQIDRLALFKTLDKNAQEKMVEAVVEFFAEVQKTGKPYFSNYSVSFIQNQNEQRAQGYSVALRMTFDSTETMNYYDGQCPQHQELKRKGAELCAEPPLVVLTTPEETIVAEDIEEGDEPSEVIRKKRYISGK